MSQHWSVKNFNLGCFGMILRHRCFDVATLLVKNFNAYAFFDVATVSCDVATLAVWYCLTTESVF